MNSPVSTFIVPVVHSYVNTRHIPNAACQRYVEDHLGGEFIAAVQCGYTWGG